MFMISINDSPKNVVLGKVSECFTLVRREKEKQFLRAT